MTFNKEKVAANAMKFLQKGALEKAVREFQKILEVYPDDERALQKVGDLYTRMGMTKKALEAYERASKLYMRQGFYLKAIAVLKQVLKLSPDRIDLVEKLAEMYHQLGLLSETIQQYNIIVEYHQKSGQEKKALDVLEKITSIDPNNLPIRIQLAEGYIKEDMQEEGLEEYTKVLDELGKTDRQDDYVRVLDRYFQHAPANIERGHELARLYIERGESKKALARLQVILKQAPEDIGTFELLAQAFMNLRQLSKTITVYREMVRILKEKSDYHELNRIYKAILEIDPDNHEAKTGLEELPFSTGVPSSEDLIDQAEEEDYEEINTLSEIEDQPPVKVVTRPEPTFQDAGEVNLVKMMTEAEVFIKYGLHDQAESRLTKILEIEPENTEALSHLKEVYIHFKVFDEAEHVLLKLAAINFQEDNAIEGHRTLEEARNLNINAGAINGLLEQFDTLSSSELAEQIRNLLGTLTDYGEKYVDEVEPVASEEAEEEIEDLPELEPVVEDVTIELESSDVDIDFDQEEIELVADEEEEFIEVELDEEQSLGEAEILEELELPTHLQPGEGKPEELPEEPAKPLKTPKKPPRLPPKKPDESISVEDEFGDQDVHELLYAQEIEHPDVIAETASTPRRKERLQEEGQAVSGEEELVGIESFEQQGDLRADRRDEPVQGSEIPTMGLEDLHRDEVAPEDRADEELEFEAIDEDTMLAGQSGEIPDGDQVERPDAKSVTEEGVGGETGFDDEVSDDIVIEDDLREEAAPPGALGPPDISLANEEDYGTEILEEFEIGEDEAEIQFGRQADSRPGDEGDDIPDIWELMDNEQKGDLEEAEFFFDQNVFEECIDIFERLLEEYTNHPFLVNRVEICRKEISKEKALRAEAMMGKSSEEIRAADSNVVRELQKFDTDRPAHGAEAGAASQPGPPILFTDDSFKELEKRRDEPADGSINLAEEILSGLDLGEEEAAPDEAPFVSGSVRVAEHIDEDDTETHFNLGIAYKEMGLLDEAIGEFLVAKKGKSPRESATMLGLCYAEKEHSEMAASHFKVVINSPDITQENIFGVRYDLGMMYQMKGKLSEALAQFKAVADSDPSFRDASKQMEELAKQGINPAEPTAIDHVLSEFKQ